MPKYIITLYKSSEDDNMATLTIRQCGFAAVRYLGHKRRHDDKLTFIFEVDGSEEDLNFLRLKLEIVNVYDVNKRLI